MTNKEEIEKLNVRMDVVEKKIEMVYEFMVKLGEVLAE